MSETRTIAYSIRPATKEDGPAMLELMPRLADFAVPPERNPVHLWKDDAKTLQAWLDDKEACIVHVAIDEHDGSVLGFSMVRLRPELLSHEPSAHLEAIALHKQAEGAGVAKKLLSQAEAAAAEQGATSMTLHVFAANERARGFYERSGYDGELMRYIKRFESDG